MIEVQQHASSDCMIFLVGNKLDIVENFPELRQVSFEEAEDFSKENKLIFFETSAFSNNKIDEFFEKIIEST